MLSAISADPSFVFFREIPDGPDGPIGALGVPLTAGRSVAVDPRTTPLGYPVFVSTSQPGRKGKLNRLVMAQDTGGAIRGAVRADYFWGFGADAYAQAARMKESGRMWLMLPNGQQIAARDQATRTRGAGSSAPTAECLVADPDLCVEDR
ncbi:MAG: lytic murein transglycosylase [Sterolibacteriaceae bacterium]|nr:lytic murein transglycosylase [Candidatus Methylophosphatis haderslevensis]